MRKYKMNKTKIFNLLTICRKAAKLTMGFDASKEAVMTDKAKLVLTTADISPKTEKEIRFFADKKNVPVIKTDISIDEMNVGLGKKVGLIAVCDEGFSKKLSELTAEE